MAKKRSPKIVDTLTHQEASRRNIPTAEHETVMEDHDREPIEVAYKRRNQDLDPQLVWRGKDLEDWSDLVVQAPPLFIQEKIHPKVLIDDLLRHSKDQKEAKATGESGFQPDLFADFNGLPDNDSRMEFYQHDANWSNRMILGDSLQVMASLAEREGMRGKVQCIYVDPPYGIKFSSNFQWSTTSRNVRDGKSQHITREPEQVKAFRDTWRSGIHSYLTYLRDRLTVVRDLLSESGSVFVQIGDENSHRVRAVMDEVFSAENRVATIVFRKTTGKAGVSLDNTYDVVVWFAKHRQQAKVHKMFFRRNVNADPNYRFDFTESGDFLAVSDRPYRIARMNPITSQSASKTTLFEFPFCGQIFRPAKGGWKTTIAGMQRLSRASRLTFSGRTLGFVRPFADYPYQAFNDIWDDTRQSGFGQEKIYVVQTASRVVERCILMTTDPGDLVLDPTCGSGTTAYIAEQWGRRWITIDTSRVALALARARIMGARYPYYILADSSDGQRKQAEINQQTPSTVPTYGNIRLGFVYQRASHITLRLIANNADIDVIWKEFQEEIESICNDLNKALKQHWQEWEIPRKANVNWSPDVKQLHAKWCKLRIARQKEIDISIASKATFQYLYDRPYEDKHTVRVSGPFTVESISPHRVIGVDEHDELLDNVCATKLHNGEDHNFASMVLEHLRTSKVQQVHREDRLSFFSVNPWPGHLVCAEGRYFEETDAENIERRAGIFVGPEFGTVARPDLVEAAREAAEAGFEVLVACAFSYDARASDFKRLGRIPVLKARINADLHMAHDLKNTGKGNLFVIFGEPDIDILPVEGNRGGADEVRVKINGVDVFHPNTGEVRTDSTDGIACWFVDTDYDQESFFVRQAYFLGAGDPYRAVKRTLKAEISQEAWSTLYSDISRPFAKPSSGRIAVKVINHLGDEVMKVFRL